MKKEKKDQFIIAYIADLDHPETVVSHASWLARMLRKGLILLHISDPRYTTVTTEDAESRLKQFCADTSHTYAALKGDTRQIITALPKLIGAVTIVAQVVPHARRRSPLSRHSILRNFADSRAAFLVVQKPLDNDSVPTDIAMSVDFKKESKDKFIWSSYFPRFCNCRMHVLHYDYRDQFLRTKWQANITQLSKLYEETGISFQSHIIPGKSTFQDINALRFTASQGYDMLISVTTKEKDGLEFFVGVQEQRTIVNKQQIPILFLNPREDLYVLCD